jgi:hypothetical protein
MFKNLMLISKRSIHFRSKSKSYISSLNNNNKNNFKTTKFNGFKKIERFTDINYNNSSTNLENKISANENKTLMFLQTLNSIPIQFQRRSFATKDDSEKEKAENSSNSTGQNNDENKDDGAAQDFPQADKYKVFNDSEYDKRPKSKSPIIQEPLFVEEEWKPDVPQTPSSFFYLMPLICVGLAVWQYFRWQEKLEILDLRVKRLNEKPVSLDQLIRSLLS